MKISEYIQHLESVRDQIGDVEVQRDGYGGRSEARQPQWTKPINTEQS